MKPTVLVVVAFVTSGLGMLPSCEPLPPEQPSWGPGGAEYPHAGVVTSSFGEGGQQYWLIEPRDPTPTSAPVVIFHHGWMILTPEFYRGWIDHLVRRGNIVLFPRYQGGPLTPREEFLPNTVAAVEAGLAVLQSEGHVTPDLSKVASVGYSTGGLLAVNLAVIAAEEGLPQPKAILCAMPGGPQWFSGDSERVEDLSAIPTGTLLLCVVGEDDHLVGDQGGRTIYNGTTQIPAEDKDYIVMHSDFHGRPNLWANHLVPLSFDGSNASLTEAVAEQFPESVLGRATNALDYYGLWKLLDGLADAAFYGLNREFALGDTPEQRYMGKWSDGTPVRELTVMDLP